MWKKARKQTSDIAVRLSLYAVLFFVLKLNFYFCLAGVVSCEICGLHADFMQHGLHVTQRLLFNKMCI